MKAIIIVDVPNDWHCKELCIEGELRGKNEDGYWAFCNEIVEAPLKPLPQKKDVPLDYGMMYGNPFGEGWNACLEEITGETE